MPSLADVQPGTKVLVMYKGQYRRAMVLDKHSATKVSEYAYIGYWYGIN